MSGYVAAYTVAASKCYSLYQQIGERYRDVGEEAGNLEGERQSHQGTRNIVFHHILTR